MWQCLTMSMGMKVTQYSIIFIWIACIAFLKIYVNVPCICILYVFFSINFALWFCSKVLNALWGSTPIHTRFRVGPRCHTKTGVRGDQLTSDSHLGTIWVVQPTLCLLTRCVTRCVLQITTSCLKVLDVWVQTALMAKLVCISIQFYVS